MAPVSFHLPTCLKHPDCHLSITYLMKVLLFLAALLLSGPSLSVAQMVPLAIDTPSPGVTSYNPAIPTPSDILGYEIGTRHTAPHEIEAYVRAVALASDRVVVREHARSHEYRALLHAIVTAPENHARLDRIQSQHRRLADNPESVSDDDMETMPVVIYQGYSVHGNEASGADAALVYLYHLAAGQGPDIEETLRNTVILLDPMLNPDGRDRFADWVNGNRGGVHATDPMDREHNEPWPGGRSNHYWFDLNRDWLVLQHPESRGRMALFHDWRPNVVTDHHEMGGNSTFFFQPGIPSRVNPNTPDRNQELTAEIATWHARYLDSIGSTYYSRESFDDFFYGKGSAFPDINGSVGILFEQGSSRALESEVADGTLHYAFTVRNQFMTSLSTLAAAADLRLELHRLQRDFYQEALRRAERDNNEAMLIDLRHDATRGLLMADVLRRHRIEVYDIDRSLRVDGSEYQPGDALVIPLRQSQYRLLKAATEETLTYEDSLFYDVSTWTLPHAFNTPVRMLDRLDREALGAPFDGNTRRGGDVRQARAGAGYMLLWDEFFAPAALYTLMDLGVTPRVAMKDVELHDGRATVRFPAGSVYIPIKRRDGSLVSEDVHEAVERLAGTWGVHFHGVATGLATDGPDLGGPSVRHLTQPVVAVLAGPGVSSLQAGEAWHALSERFRIPVSLIEPDDLTRADLSRYSVIVVPGGRLPSGATEVITGWVRRGGRLLVMAGATSWAIDNELLDAEERSLDMDSLSAGQPWSLIPDARGAQAVGGTILLSELDETHPLSFGIGGMLPVFHNNSEFFESTGGPGTRIGYYGSNALLSGYISDERLADTPGAATLVVERLGSGRVVAFMNRVNFRAYWLGSQRVFMNAVLFHSAY
ncbi:MAG: peptidase M14 [Bacteroidetes bacterium CG12_big_fil_rev_8_21_14_0_65_60_17]|nr:MAG: peptidase M14 [Bacteroidetes bacterium CG12_big_fil_rev_8_21_14_0_65_60_17]